ncbi:MAG: class I SAM-dependent RNA methyltransferase [Anaerolineae bacterium]|jgi:23S rRNA (uracil1939-C5)-methyltransferase
MESFNLELTDMAHGGAALGRHEGKVIFVPYGLPGETVRVELVEDRSRYAHARLVDVLEPSPARVSPPCPYFGPQGCGGCQWQHVEYEAQLRLKADVVADQLERIGRLDEPRVRPTLADPSGWAYRNRARFHLAANGELGFRAASNDRVVPVEECLILHPLLSELYSSLDLDLPELRALILRAAIATGDRMLIFDMEEDKAPALVTDVPVSCVLLRPDSPPASLVGRDYLVESVAGYSYRVSASSFFQVNTPQAAQLLQLVLEYLELEGGEVVLDGYCGVGLFTVPLTEQAGLVIAVESAYSPAEDLLENTDGIENVEVIEGPVGAVLADIESLDAAVVDPPRKGLEREVVEGLIAAEPNRIVYVSCDPATLARDGRQLAQAGYRMIEAQPVDMFPQTYHVETVSLWERTNLRG